MLAGMQELKEGFLNRLQVEWRCPEEMIVLYTELKMVERMNLVDAEIFFGNRTDGLADKQNIGEGKKEISNAFDLDNWV